MNGFKLTMAIAFAGVLAVLGSAVGRVDAETMVFQDNFEGRTAGDLLSVALPQVGAAYTSGSGHARSTATNPPGSVPAGGSIFAQTAGGDYCFLTLEDASVTTDKVSQFDLDVYITDGSNVGGLDLITFTDTSLHGRGFDIFFHADGAVSYYDGSSHDVTGTFSRGVWQHVTVNADYNLHTFTASIGSLTFSGNACAANSYGYIDLVGSSTFYDNVSVRVDPVPEPGAVVLLVTGLIGLLAYAWRKRK